jgi:uncharacterized protein YacL
MFCKYCGKETTQNTIFCSSCGEKIGDTKNTPVKENNSKGGFKNNLKQFIANKKLFFWAMFSLWLIAVSILFWSTESKDPSAFSGYAVLLIIASVLWFLFTGIILWLKNTPKLTDEELKKYNGLADWLVLIAIGLILSFFIALFDIASLENNSDKVLGGILLILNAYVIYLFFTKKKLFKRFFIILLIINFLINMILLVDNNEEATKQFGRSLFALIIWVPYIMKSKRARATFIK